MAFDPRTPPSQLKKMLAIDKGSPNFEVKREAFFVAIGGEAPARLTDLESNPERYVVVGEPMISVVQPAASTPGGFMVFVTYWEIVGWREPEAPPIVSEVTLPSAEREAEAGPVSDSDTMTPPSPYAPAPPE